MARAAGFGSGAGWVLSPPVSQKEASTEFGAEISEAAWLDICLAFRLHGRRLDELKGTRDNQNPNDKQGWKRRKGDAANGIETALAALNRVDRDFLAEAENIVSFKRSGGIESYDCLQRLNTALDEILFLSWIMREADPLAHEIMTEADSRKALACDVYRALEGAGAKLSNGWALAQGDPSLADLTGFERLAELLEIHQGDTPKATAKWLRDALAQER